MQERRILLNNIEQINQVEPVDLGLSVKWAPGNICKDSEGNYYIGAPTDQGCYFSWGNVEGYNKDERPYFMNNTYKSTPGYSLTSDISATSGYDTARETLGGSWRMPTRAECLEIIDNCTCTWTTQDGVAGMRFTSKKSGYTDNSIFIPASGRINSYTLQLQGTEGIYLSSNAYSSNSAYTLDFRSDSQSVSREQKFNGCTIRAVQ